MMSIVAKNERIARFFSIIISSLVTVYSSLAIVHVRVQSLIAFSCSKLVAKAIFSNKF